MISSQKFNKSFEELMLFLQKPKVINDAKHFLQQNGLNILPRKFLSFFMIYYHSKELFDTQDEISIELLKQVKRCIRVVDSLNLEYKEFKLKILHYTVGETEKWFDIWKKRDKYKIILPMIHMYHHLEEQKTIDSTWNQEIDKQKTLIKTKLFQLDKNCQDLLENPPRIKIDPAAQKNVVNVMYKAYWDKFQKSIEDKQWDQLISFIEEIKTMLKQLVPHRTDLHESIDFSLDTSLLKDRLENNNISNESIFELMSIIIDYIRQFQAPIDDQDTEEWWSHLQKQTSWGILMRDFFMIAFAKIEKITIVATKIKNNTII